MRSRPIGTPLSEEEAAVVARFDAAPVLPESWESRSASCTTCRHLEADHGTDRNGRVVCWGASCGCGEFVAVTA